MNSYLQLNFKTNMDEKFSLRIPKTYDGILPSTVKTAMTSLITANAIDTKKGDLVSTDSAYLFTVTKTEFDLN